MDCKKKLECPARNHIQITMARLRTPNQKKKYEALKGRLNQYSYLVQTVYDTLNEEAAKIAESTGYDGEREFKWSDYPATKKRIDAIQQRFVNEIQGIIHTGTSKEWKESNLVQDLLAGRVLRYYDVVAHGDKYQKLYYQTNLDALQAFQERVENGMTLSDRVWSQAVGYRRELECAISTGVERGMSAVTLSKRISKYLKDFPTLQADYKEKYGKVVDCLNCEYRSMRLARTEINMAYRVAEQKRWSQLDFVLGYEIKLSGSHPVTDICDSLKGRYPKDFKFVGWHPNCYCYCIPILKTEEEFWSDDEVTGVEEPPKSFGEWVKDNEERLSQAAERGTLPYWYTDNEAYVKAAKPLKYAMTSKDSEILSYYGFNRISAKSYNSSAINGFNLVRFNTAIEQIGDDYDIYWKKRRADILSNGNVSLTFKGVYKNEEAVLERTFRISKSGSVEVIHNLFTLPECLQGKGIARRVTKALFDEYKDAGISKVRIMANIEYGSYCWAKYGFLAESKKEIENITKIALEIKDISKAEYDSAISIINTFKGDKGFPVRELAYEDYGKRLLVGLDKGWDGYVDMKDKKNINYLYKYIGEKN